MPTSKHRSTLTEAADDGHRAALPGRIGDVDLRLLRVFKAVADCGGMAAAELALGLSMSTISRHVKDLELRLGLTLCRRGRSGFGLTPEGTQLYDAAAGLLAATEGFRARLNDIHQGMAGDLHVAVFEKTASNPAARVPEAVAAFRAQAPLVELHMSVGTIATIERGVIEGQVQLGIIPEHRRSKSLRYDELFDENMLLYAGHGHPWWSTAGTAAAGRAPGWADLRRQPLVGLGYQSPNLSLALARELPRAAIASDQEAVAMLVLSGAYVGFLPDHYAAPFVAQGRLYAVSPGTLNYQCRFSCIRRRSPALTRVAETFRRALVQAHRAREPLT